MSRVRERLRRNMFRTSGGAVAGPDTTPDAFSFVDQTGVALSTVITSAPVTITGMTAAAVISVTGGSYNINGGSYTSAPGTVVSGDVVRARVTSSASNSANANVVITIGGVSDTFTATTLASADTTPDAFTFTDQTGVALSTAITSAPITVSGIDTATAITVSGGQYSINGGAFTSTAGTVVNGDVVRARVTSSGSGLTAASCVVTIGGVSDTFTATTSAAVAALATIQAWSGSTLLDQTGDYGDGTTRQGVNGNGWVAKATMPYLVAQTFDPTKITFTVQDPGYDATTTVTRTRTITGRKVLRRQYTSNANPQSSSDGTTFTVYFSLSELIYQGSTIVSVDAAAGYYGSSAAGSVPSLTNSSTVPYPKPLFAWLNTQHDRWTGDTLVEAVAYHRHAMNGRQIARIEFIASDASSHTAATQTDASPSLSAIQTQGNIVECYSATIPLSALTQGDLCLVNAKVYPWIGDSSAVLDLVADGVSTSGAVTTARPRTPLRFLNDKSGTYGGATAYVKAGAAGTPQVSLTAATSRANPYPTINAALAAIVTFNNANRGHNDHSGGAIYLMDDGASGAVAHTVAASLSGNAAGKCWTDILPDPLATGAVSVNRTGATVQTADLLRWKVNMTQTNAWFDGGTSNGNVRQAIDGKTLTIATGPGVPLFYRCGLIYLRNVTIVGANGGSETMVGVSRAERIQCAQALGVVVSSPAGNHGFYPYSVIGCELPRGSMGEIDIVANPNWDTSDWGVVANNKMLSSRLSNTVAVTQNYTNFAFVQNVIERAVTASNPALQISADDALFAVDHFVDHHNTVVGERMNRCYQTKPGDIGVLKRCDSRFNIWYEYNCKTDTFDLGGTETSKGRNGNWAERHTVGHLGNVCLVGDHNAASPLNAGGSGDVWIGDAWPDGLFAVGRANVTFTNDQSLPGGNAGMGTYTLTHGGTDKAANRVPAGLAVLAYDLAGTARPNDGTGSAGAYQ